MILALALGLIVFSFFPGLYGTPRGVLLAGTALALCLYDWFVLA